LDGKVLRPVNSPVLRHRRRMVYNGSVAVTILVDSDGGLLVEPRFAAQGLYDIEEEPEVEAAAARAIESALHKLSRHQRRQDASLQEAMRVAVRRALQRELGKKPMVEIQLIRLD